MKKLFMILTAAAFLCITTACGTTDVTTGVTTVEASTEIDIMEVGGLCGMCKTNIEQAAQGVDGVIKAEWDRESKILTLEFDPAKTQLGAISKAIANVGYDTEMDKADDEVYVALPDCCKYRDDIT